MVVSLPDLLVLSETFRMPIIMYLGVMFLCVITPYSFSQCQEQKEEETKEDLDNLSRIIGRLYHVISFSEQGENYFWRGRFLVLTKNGVGWDGPLLGLAQFW